MLAEHVVEISYCPKGGWLLRATWMAQELLTTFRDELAQAALIPDQRGGIFEIRVDKKLAWSRSESGRFPETASRSWPYRSSEWRNRHEMFHAVHG